MRAAGLALLAVIFGGLFARRATQRAGSANPIGPGMTHYELTPYAESPRAVRRADGLSSALQLGLLAGMTLVIAAGFLGTPVGSRNFAIVMVWIAWWAALMLVAVPGFGRAWCSVCPLPLPGEWLQRGAILAPRGRGLGLKLRWPRRLRKMWVQNAAFVARGARSACPCSPSLGGPASSWLGLVLAAVGAEPRFRAPGLLPLRLPGGRLHRPVRAGRAG